MISCETHDYVEIVCTYRYPIKLTLNSGAVIEGVGVDTRLDANRLECIVLETNDGTSMIALTDIAFLEACVENPHVRRVCFNDKNNNK